MDRELLERIAAAVERLVALWEAETERQGPPAVCPGSGRSAKPATATGRGTCGICSHEVDADVTGRAWPHFYRPPEAR